MVIPTTPTGDVPVAASTAAPVAAAATAAGAASRAAPVAVAAASAVAASAAASAAARAEAAAAVAASAAAPVPAASGTVAATASAAPSPVVDSATFGAAPIDARAARPPAQAAASVVSNDAPATAAALVRVADGGDTPDGLAVAAESCFASPLTPSRSVPVTMLQGAGEDGIRTQRKRMREYDGAHAVPPSIRRNDEWAGGFDAGRRVDDPLSRFDSDQFLDAMSAQNVFDSPDEDDINIVAADVDGDQEMETDSDLSGSELGDVDPLELDDAEPLWGVDDVDAVNFNGIEDLAATEGYMTHQDLRDLASEGWTTYDAVASRQVEVDAADDLYDGPSGPTKSATAFSQSPLGLFFYFLPKLLWWHIAKMTNAYRQQNIQKVAEEQHAKALARKAADPTVIVKDVTTLVDELTIRKPIEVHELLHYIGLLIARVLSPHRDGLRRHWSQEPDGATPAGTFGKYMARNRFEEISRFLHFSDNLARPEKRDRAVKIRPVLQALEKTFRRGYRLGARISFEEGMIPNRSQFNPIRVYMAAKPNKWGTKFFLTRCADTAYCSRIEVYCGAEGKEKPVYQHGQAKPEPTPIISAIVVRNITKALSGMHAKRLVVIDNYYTSTALAIKLLDLGLYMIGTIRTNRLGWCGSITYKQQVRPKSIDRGTFRLAVGKDHPVVALSWMDSKPVNFLATGCATTLTTVSRREKNGLITQVECPEMVVDYLQNMGGVDVQLRLQRYSIQKIVRYRKYYRSLFMGLVDMALINGYIVYKFGCKKRGETPMTHAEYMNRLHKSLLGLSKASVATNMNAEDLLGAPVPPATHVIVQVPAMYSTESHDKHRQYVCKVCSAFGESKKKSFETSWYCQQCSDDFGGHVALCHRARLEETGNKLTCTQVWHETWANGTATPQALRKKIRFRKHKEATRHGEEKANEA